MSSPVAARVAVDALGMTPRNYGHLVMMAARYARQRFDGHAVVNRQTGARVMLDWERGLKNATASGMPVLLLLAVPAIPAMLAAARYLGALAPRPPYPPHVFRYHAFEATAEIGGRRIKAILIVQEDRQRRLFLDRVLGGEALPHRDAGGANPPNSAMPPADVGVSTDPDPSSAGAPPPVPTAPVPAATDNSNPPAAASVQDAAPPPPPAPIPLSDIQKPVQFRGADYEAMGARLRYLNGKYDPQSWGDQIASAFTGGLNDPSRVMTDSERAERQALKDKLNQTISDHYDPQPTPDEARLDNMASSPLGTAAWLGARALGASQQQQDAALGTVGALENIGTAVVGPHTPVEPVLNVPAVEAARAVAAKPETAFRTAPPPDGEGTAMPLSPTSPEAPQSATTPPVGGSSAAKVVESAAGHKPRPGESSAYNRINDFEQFRADGGYGDDPLSQNNAARDYVMQQQHGGGEHYAAYDADTNEVTHAGTSYKEEESTLSSDLETALHDPDAKLTLHHGHPNNIPLSSGDVSLLGMPGTRWIVVHGIDGDISAARLTPEARTALANADHGVQQEAEDSLRRLHNDAYAAARGPIDEAVDRGELPEADANRINAEIANRALAVKGVTEYVTTHSLPSHPAIDEAQRLANAEMDKNVGQQIPELANVHPNPAPQPTGIDEAMGRISRTDAGAVAGRPGRARGGASGARRAGRARRQDNLGGDQRAPRRRDSGKHEAYPRGPGKGAQGEAREEIAPPIARVSGHELEMPPTSYGHLIILAARYAWMRLDGHAVVNRETRVPIALTWERGLKEIVAPGTALEMLLAVPAIPAMLAAARYLGSAPDPLHRPDIAKVHGFASAVEVGGRRIDVLMVVRENRQGRLFLDRMERRAAAGARAA
jgi:hypothetical protein